MVCERGVVMMQLVAMLVCVALPMAMAGLERVCVHEQSQYRTKYMCGRNLANIIQMVCRLPAMKRSADATVKTITQEVDPPMGTHMSPFMDKAQAMAYLYKRSYSSGSFHKGVVCECCYHRCTPMELQQYCSTDKRALAPASPQKRFVGIMATSPQHHTAGLRPSDRLASKNSAVDLSSYIQAASALNGHSDVFENDKDSYRLHTTGNRQKLSRDDLQAVDHQDTIEDPTILFA